MNTRTRREASAKHHRAMRREMFAWVRAFGFVLLIAVTVVLLVLAGLSTI